MDKIPKENIRKTSLLVAVILAFIALAAVVFSVSRQISREMSNSAIQNLSETLELITCTIESTLENEAEFQVVLADEIARSDDPLAYVQALQKNKFMVKYSLILSGESTGVSNNGELFSENGLSFSAGDTVAGFPVSESYVNYMGTWAYTIKCPVIKDSRQIADFYVEYSYDSLNRALPESFYNNNATLYIMDTRSQRFVLKPKGMGMRDAGHLNLDDFYRANVIDEPELLDQVDDCLENAKNILFYHDIRNQNSLNYMWAVNGGMLYLSGYVSVEAIQQEARSVTRNIFLVIVTMTAAFLICSLVYYYTQRQQNRIRREREAEREVHNRQLNEALKAAQIANQSKTTFLSNMSHDIRTPMNAVLGFTTLLLKDADNPAKVREYTRKITASGKHLLSLINDILDVSKIESGKVVLSLEKFSLNDVVSSVDAIIQPMAQEKKQRFHVEVSNIRHEYLIGDETRINQILLNLLSNSVKYTPAGGDIWLRILGLKQRSPQYEHIRIEVEDTGYGMTPEYLKVIFDAFTRAENSTTNKVQGTGLGMAITKSVVELMGGTIEVTSEVNKGSLFRVELECRIPEDQIDRAFWKQHGISRLLLLSRDPSSIANIEALTESFELSVETAATLDEALRLTRDGVVRQPIADWEALGDDPASAVRQLREAIPPTVPLVLLTTYSAIEDADLTALENDNTGILLKPFFVSALQQKLTEMQSGKPADPAALPEEDHSLDGLRFLAAEDNDINAEILTELLDIEGASCEHVENGRLAVERFQNAAPGTFDAILMDVQMPVMNGYDATRAIRALPRGDAKSIPIIAMTANAFAEDEKAALDSGMDAHVPKPLDIDQLKKVIRHHIERKSNDA